jgi:hypothetical protein
MSKASRMPRWPLLAALAVTLASGATLLAANPGTPKPAPPKPDPATTAVAGPTIDPELLTFVRAAKLSQGRGDPLLRCLGFPDWPGNAWPAGLPEAHCHFLFDPVPSLAEVAAALTTGDLAGIDARYLALLEGHFDATAPSESIHTAFARFDASADAGTVSTQWLELAPDSAFARAARASHLLARAQPAPDAEEPPPGSAERAATDALVEGAAELYRQALVIEPRLLPAHAELARIALDRGDDTGADAILAGAEPLDPACLDLARVRLSRLSPRHGGTLEAMQAHIDALRAAHPGRVLLALAAADEAIERGRAMLKHERFGAAQLELRPALQGSTSPAAFEEAAMAAVRAPSPDHHAALAMLVASARFRPGRTGVRDLRARLLINAGERAWAMTILNDAGEATAVAPLLAQSGAARNDERIAR